jgi:hypothetical protein
MLYQLSYVRAEGNDSVLPAPMALLRILTLALLVALATGCALSENEEDRTAGAAVKTLLEHEYVGDYGTAWDSLHPRHQRLVTRPEYEECRRGIDVRGTIESVLVLSVRDEPLTVFGLPPQTPSKAVRVRVTTDESEYTATYHVVKVGDEWRWVLTDQAARGFARGPCPA